MGFSYLLLISLLAIWVAGTDAAECENGWRAYKDELCIKVFPNLLSYDEAQSFCFSQGNEISPASLVMVKEEDMQVLLMNHNQDIFDNLWLGGRYVEEEYQFKWDDGEALTYSNWQEGYPRNASDGAPCMELRPKNFKMDPQSEGKWANVACQKRNLVMCQKTLSWTLSDAIIEIIKMRKQISEGINERNALRENLQAVSSKVVPIGSVYIEYYSQPSPRALWPNLTWEDITGTYAGLFFRASEGGSGGWGATQSECAPRIGHIEYKHRRNSLYPYQIEIPAGGWSEWGHAGVSYHGCSCQSSRFYMALRYQTSSCEVRPKNQAIRIWKRTG